MFEGIFKVASPNVFFREIL